MIRERTRAGLSAARAEGRVGGRRRKLDALQQAEVIDNVLSGRRTAAQMARLYKVSEATVSRLLAAQRQAMLPAVPDEPSPPSPPPIIH